MDASHSHLHAFTDVVKPKENAKVEANWQK